MCGIVGFFPGTKEDVEQALAVISHRGNDARHILHISEGCVGHVLHSVVGHVEQPLRGKGILLFNGEIYNWKELAHKEGVAARNDAEILLHLLDTYTVEEVRKKLDGVYAYIYVVNNMVYAERDILGVKPLWYAEDEGVYLASEKKALTKRGFVARELHPRSTLQYDLDSKRLSRTVRPFVFAEEKGSFSDVLVACVKKRIPDSKRIGVLCSGVDSALLAALAKEAGADVTLYVAGGAQAPDVLYARKVSEKLGCALREVTLSKEAVSEVVALLCPLIESSDVTKIESAIPVYLCCMEAKKDKQRVLFSGVGADEVLGELQRQKRVLNVSDEAKRKLRTLFERSLYKDDIISMEATIEMRLPYLDLAVVGKEHTKEDLRTYAQEFLGDLALEKRRAPHYGSRVNKLVDKLAKKKTHAQYLSSFYPRNAKLCALLSTGKDSIYSLYLMQQRNYDVCCAATIVSDNPHSYMYHTPAIDFASMQAKALGISLLTEETAGEKEKELSALYDVLKRAKEEFGVEGVVSGAIFSDYQRTRIEKVCEELGLYVFAPLWHLDQQSYVEEVLRAGFEIVFSRVAAYGLDKTVVGEKLDESVLQKLLTIPGMNVAGEGGEYETLVLDGPNFSSRIVLQSKEVVCENKGEDSDVCELRAVGKLEKK